MKSKITIAIAALTVSGSALAAVSAEEIKQLGTTLTPWGAIAAGNKEGTIPAYDGGIPVDASPAGYKKDSGHWADPYAGEKPLYSITGKKMAQYEDKLSEATKELLRRFPTFRVDVYPTHRTVNFKKRYIDATLKNAERCRTVENGNALKGCIGGLAFPIPKTGNEAMWNILTAQKDDLRSEIQGLYIDSNGTPVVTAIQKNTFQYPYFDSKESPEEYEKRGSYLFRSSTLNKYPPRIAGDGTTYWWTADPVNNPNKGWQYQQGNRRIRSLPDPQYDYPVLVSGGAMFFDEVQIFNGNLDRFDWKLLGKKEMLIPYSTYRFLNEGTPEKLAAAGRHPNPDLIRWELHRVNVVEGTLKPGMRHAYLKRRIYIDEDITANGMTDAWDHAGKIFKGYWSTAIWAYDYQTVYPVPGFNYDLSTGISYFPALLAQTKGVFYNNMPVAESDLAPEAMLRATAR